MDIVSTPPDIYSFHSPSLCTTQKYTPKNHSIISHTDIQPFNSATKHIRLATTVRSRSASASVTTLSFGSKLFTWSTITANLSPTSNILYPLRKTLSSRCLLLIQARLQQHPVLLLRIVARSISHTATRILLTVTVPYRHLMRQLL